MERVMNASIAGARRPSFFLSLNPPLFSRAFPIGQASRVERDLPC